MISVLVIGRLLLAAVFGVSGIAKIADLSGNRKSIADFGLPEFLAWPVSASGKSRVGNFRAAFSNARPSSR